MRITLCALLCLLAAASLVAQAPSAGVEVALDAEQVRAVLAAVQDPALTRERALAIARLPGNQGLIRKSRSYGNQSSDDLLADALLGAAQHKPSPADTYFRFATVRDDAPRIQKTLAALLDPAAGTLATIQARTALFTPPRIKGRITGYLIVGGSSGGFAFSEPALYLNLEYFPSALLAKTILSHELYHAIQGLASKSVWSDKAQACLKTIPGGENLAQLYTSLQEEGTASYVGDVLAMNPGDDEVAKAEFKRVNSNVHRFGRSITLLELSALSLATSKTIDYDDVYALGFYDDEILYSIGYVMARAIATERGPAALADVLDKPAPALVTAYLSLSGYGKSDAMPKLGADTIAQAAKLAACAAQ
jgi:hypothetical protein